MYEKPKPKAKKPKARRQAQRRPSGPVLSSFAVRSKRLYLLGSPATVAFRIDGRRPLRDVRLYLVPAGSRKPASTIKLGPLARGTDHRIRVTGTENGVLAQGTYTVRVAAKDSRGRRLRRGAGISSTASLAYLHHRFPIAGPVLLGRRGLALRRRPHGPSPPGPGPRRRRGHPGRRAARRHGQDRGRTRPRAPATTWCSPPPARTRDYVFMHLRTGSIPVTRGQTVRTGQQIGQVGNTGRSFGAHLHFEIWIGGGWYTGGKPVDPLPYLKAWPR